MGGTHCLGAIDHTPDILCTEEWVLDVLQSLNTAKASGHDGISAHMLEPTASAIYSSLNYQTLQSVYTIGSATYCLEKCQCCTHSKEIGCQASK